MLTGTYRPGTSPLHRAPAGLKLLGLLALTTALVAGRSPLAVAVGALAVATLYAVARLPASAVVAQVWPLRWVLLLLAGFQVWTAGWRAAVQVVGVLLVAVAAAGLVTLTTRVTDLLDAFVAGLTPLRRLGVDPERVALVLALALRAVPVLLQTSDRVRDARRARGLERSTRALVTPLVLGTIRHADAVGEALAARGVDD
ncbi:MAG TPA: CbiQ family ECF transporter T component [Dermatophilaceae bacterium]|nr:CbiQ family ECF transporter T component [Dermatophilaceae bacterium]